MGSHYNGLPHGLLYIAAVLRENHHSVRVYNADYENRSDYLQQVDRLRKFDLYTSIYNDPDHYIWNETVDTIISYDPKSVGFTMSTATSRAVAILSEKIKWKSPYTTIIVGGVHPTIALAETMSNRNYNYAVKGEGEYAILKLLEGHALNTIQGMAYWDNRELRLVPNSPIMDLDSLPFPARDLIMNPHENTEFGHVITGRGCPFACTYCASPVIWGRKRARLRSVQNVMMELFQITVDHPGAPIYFDDDTFTFDKERTEKLCKEIISQGLNIEWQCHTRVDCVDGNLLKLMRQAGCVNIKVGVESGSERILKSIKKGINKEEVLDAAWLIKSAGIKLTVFLMTGFPSETDHDLRQTIDFARQLKADHYNLSIVTPYYGTELYHDFNRPSGTGNWEYFHQSPKMAMNDNLSPKMIEEFLELR